MKSFIKLQNNLSRLINQNCGSIRTYGDQVSHLLIHLSSFTLGLHI